VILQIRSIAESSISESQAQSGAIVVACGYEHRSQGITSLLTVLPPHKHALCFREFPEAIARAENEAFFLNKGFTLHNVSSNDAPRVQAILDDVILSLPEGTSLFVDISTMTRTWHGAMVRQLRMKGYAPSLKTYFAYTPAVFRLPPTRNVPNEFVMPVAGFAALSTPELPVAAIIGLGYEREGALGLQQILDPARTILLIPNIGAGDPYYAQVLKNNKDILDRTALDWKFDYSLAEPASTFSMLASLIGGLRESHRIVLASLGPKMFGLICFLLAAQFPDVSVWRVSSGVHGQPRDSRSDLARAVVLEINWQL
jgi:hypothetical protein